MSIQENTRIYKLYVDCTASHLAVLERRSGRWTNVLASLLWVRQFRICLGMLLEKYTGTEKLYWVPL